MYHKIKEILFYKNYYMIKTAFLISLNNINLNKTLVFFV